MRVPKLPAERRVDLSDLWAPGLTGVVRPADPLELAGWHDAFPNPESLNEKAIALVRQRLVRVEGPEGQLVTVGEEDEAFDPAKAGHFACLPFPAILRLYSEAARGPDRPEASPPDPAAAAAATPVAPPAS